MSIALKVRGGTRSASLPRLCDTCHRGVVRRGDASGAEEIYCRQTERPVFTRVVECSQHSCKGSTIAVGHAAERLDSGDRFQTPRYSVDRFSV